MTLVYIWQIFTLYFLHESQRYRANVAQGQFQSIFILLLCANIANGLHQTAYILDTHRGRPLGQMAFQQYEFLRGEKLWGVLAELHDGLRVESFEGLSVELRDVLGFHEGLALLQGQDEY